MKKPAIEVRAGLLNATNQKRGASFSVLSSAEVALDENAEMRGYACSHCKTHFSALASLEPFCVNCGSDEIETEDEAITEEMIDDSELSAITCKACGVHSIVTNETAKLLGGSMSCVACGKDITYILATDEDSTEEELDENVDEELSEGDDLEDDTLDIDSADDEELSEGDDTEDVTLEESEGDSDEDISLDDTEPVDTTSEETLELSMLEVSSGAFSLMTANDKLIASLGDVPVAVLSKENAGDNKEIFSSKTMAEAIYHTVGQIGVEKALAHYKFAPIIAKFPVKKVVDEKVKASLAEKSSKVEARIKDVALDLSQCLSIAAAGLTKGFFKGKDNALKSALVSKLSALGVRSPNSVVDSVFASSSSSYHKVLLELATELMERPLEIRNELAEAIDVVNPVQQNTEEEEDEEDIESRLESASVVNRRKPKATESASASDSMSTISRIRQSVGGSLFKIPQG